MEDVLDVYRLPYDPERPLVCLDEKSKQLLDHTREPIAAVPGRPMLVDDEYRRQGTANIFAAIEPLSGACLVQATEHRTAIDMAHFLRAISDEMCATARVIRLVMDNLNIHGLPCLYQAFEPAEARRIAKRFEIHHTPKHGSWLNIAEAFLSTVSRECLNQRIGTLHDLQASISSWRDLRYAGKVVWRFTTEDARIKLRRLYPSIS
jgi:hypothetical protein